MYHKLVPQGENPCGNEFSFYSASYKVEWQEKDEVCSGWAGLLQNKNIIAVHHEIFKNKRKT
ncbi:MAG TPA: hypothetical protein VN374_02700 [Desulfitobacteriaceae bacterium]|nr:hypothetical protein [Desulfitobacteriaceae bacterium]